MVERVSRGSEVVKPIWLLMMICTVPPVPKPRVPDRFSVSITTPCAANAASPCRRTGITWSPVLSSRRRWRARTEPSTTGSTISRWEGLNASEMCTGPPLVEMSEENPLWYFTSPEGSSEACLPSNSRNRSFGILPSTLTSTLSRPRCAMPITISELVAPRLELRDAGPRHALERIDRRPARAGDAVCGHQQQRRDLQPLRRHRLRRQGPRLPSQLAGLRALHEGFDHRRVRHILGGVSGQHLDAVEVLAPFLGDGLRVHQVLLVQVLDEARVGAVQVRVVEELAHHGCHGLSLVDRLDVALGRALVELARAPDLVLR